MWRYTHLMFIWLDIIHWSSLIETTLFIKSGASKNKPILNHTLEVFGRPPPHIFRAMYVSRALHQPPATPPRPLPHLHEVHPNAYTKIPRMIRTTACRSEGTASRTNSLRDRCIPSPPSHTPSPACFPRCASLRARGSCLRQKWAPAAREMACYPARMLPCTTRT